MPIIDVYRRQPLSGRIRNEEIHLRREHVEKSRQPVGSEGVANMQADSAEVRRQVRKAAGGGGAWREVGTVNRCDRPWCYHPSTIRGGNGGNGTGRPWGIVQQNTQRRRNVTATAITGAEDYRQMTRHGQVELAVLIEVRRNEWRVLPQSAQLERVAPNGTLAVSKCLR